MRTGRLKPGTPLPSTRALAAQLGISRGLVVGAYAQLGAEGYLLLRRGASPRVARVAASPEPAVAAQADQPAHNLRPDLPDYARLPARQVAHLVPRRAEGRARPRARLRRRPRRPGASRRRSSRTSAACAASPRRAEHAFVCGGFAQAIGLLCATLRRSGRSAIGVEDPGHAVIREIVARTGLRPVPIPVDDEGIDVDALEAAGPDAVLVTPAHQFPTGVVLSPERRARLLEWAERRDAIVVEDDYDAEFRYDRAPVGALQGLSPDRVAYLGSASKTLAPTLRLGWLIAAAAARPAARRRGALHGDRAAAARAARVRRLPRARRARPAPAPDAPPLPAPARRADRGARASSCRRSRCAGSRPACTSSPSCRRARTRRASSRRRSRARISLYGSASTRSGRGAEAALLLGYAVSPEPAIRAAVAKLAEAVEAASA